MATRRDEQATARGWAAGKDPRLVPYGETNLGTPLDLVDDLLVPNSLFFVRSNYLVPRIDAASWRLHVGGLVARPLALSLADLRALPQRTLVAFLECSGNSRTRFLPVAEGTTWQNDAVGNAEWQGVPLAAVLDLAGFRPEAVDVVCQGGDDLAMRRGLPLRAALDPDTLLVWRMNGEDLPVAHGGPVRLLVPGWGGIASTKWLVGLELIDRPFDGFWNAVQYVLYAPSDEALGRVEEMPVKSVIARPGPDARLVSGEVLVSGYAWSGHGAIEQVDVSVDGGATYAAAEIIDEAGPRSWVRFAYRWQARPGPARLRARATDRAGQTQPETVPWNAKGYLMNAIHEVPVVVSG